MIIESAILSIKPGLGPAFEAALKSALPLIEATPGFAGIEVRPCVEKPDQYLLLVRWERLEDHTIGFRQSDRYPKWRDALHHFYEPMPVVLHYREQA
ncbi:MAG TPA: antibiotic biosynthesis monooxygenase [Micropepsaceae bacterium]|nr:antibiotic biosynthesis monooxygenase [Micropepsaceae bacterium]